MVCAGTKFDDACTAETCSMRSGEFDFSLKAAKGNSCKPQTRIAATPVRGTLSLAVKELWQSSLCVDDKLAHAREPQSEAQSGATSIARRVKIAIARRRKKAFGQMFMLILQATLCDSRSQLNPAARFRGVIHLSDGFDPSRPQPCRRRSDRRR